MYKLNNNELESLANMLSGSGWQAFKKLINLEKEKRKENILSFLSNGKVEEATRESQRVEDFEFMIKKAEKEINKKEIKEEEKKKSEYEILEDSIPNGLI